MATLIYNTGYEHGIFSSVSSASLVSPQTGLFTTASTGGVTVGAEHAHTGNYGIGISASGAASLARTAIVGTGNNSVHRFYVRFNSFTGFQRFWHATHGTTAFSMNFSGSEGHIYAMVAGAQLGGTYSITTGTWYRIDVRVQGGATGTFDVNINDTVLLSGATGTFSATPLASIELGTSNPGTFDLSFDDVAVSATSADFPLGPGYGQGIKPKFPGLTLHSSGTFVRDATATVITADDYTRLDDDPMGQTTDYIRQTGGSSTQPGGSVGVNFGTQETPANAANGVRAIAQYTAAGTQANNSRIWAAAQGVNTYLHGSASTQPTIGSTSQCFSTVQVANGGLSWTDARVDGVQIFFGSGGGTDVNPIPAYHAFMLEVDWPLESDPEPPPRAQRYYSRYPQQVFRAVR